MFGPFAVFGGDAWQKQCSYRVNCKHLYTCSYHKTEGFFFLLKQPQTDLEIWGYFRREKLIFYSSITELHKINPLRAKQNSSRWHFFLLLLSFKEIRLDVSLESSATQWVYMKYQVLFSLKNI